jgi:hypothetical protein
MVRTAGGSSHRSPGKQNKSKEKKPPEQPEGLSENSLYTTVPIFASKVK